MRLEAVEAVEGFFVDLYFQRLFGLAFRAGFGQSVQPFLPLGEFVAGAAAEEELADDEVAAVVVVVYHPVGDVGDVARFYFVLDGVIYIQAADFHGGFAAGFAQPDVWLADGDERSGFFVFLEQAVLHEVVVHPGFGDFERAEARGLRAALDVALEAEAEDDQPVGIAALAALFDGVVDRLLADGAEFWADMKVRLLFATRRLVEPFGMKRGAREPLDADEDRLFVANAVLDARRFEVLEDPLLEARERFVTG